MHYSSGDDELVREDCVSVDKLRTDEYLTLKIKLYMDFFFFGLFEVFFLFSPLTSLVIYIILIILSLYFQASFNYSIMGGKLKQQVSPLKSQ